MVRAVSLALAPRASSSGTPRGQLVFEAPIDARVDAQSALTQARLNLVRSKYQRALSRVQLRRTMGG
jgi:hypothetical protein